MASTRKKPPVKGVIPDKFDSAEELSSKKKTPTAPKLENLYKGKSVLVPELHMTVKIREGSTLKAWLIRYCTNHPLKKAMLYKAYNITQEDVENTSKHEALVQHVPGTANKRNNWK